MAIPKEETTTPIAKTTRATGFYGLDSMKIPGWVRFYKQMIAFRKQHALFKRT